MSNYFFTFGHLQYTYYLEVMLILPNIKLLIVLICCRTIHIASFIIRKSKQVYFMQIVFRKITFIQIEL